MCRTRFDEWSYRLAAHRDALHASGVSRRARRWEEIMPMLQEILLNEPLIRNLACMASLLEQLEICDELCPLTQSMLVSQIEARHRCLHLIVFGHGLPVESAVLLNRLRQNVEAYTDNLLAVLPPDANTESFGFNNDAILKTRNSLCNLRDSSGDGKWLRLHTHNLSSQLWRKLQIDVDWRMASGRLNHSISQAILSLFPKEIFDDLGLPHQANAISIIAGESPESDGKESDPATVQSPLSLLIKKPARLENVDQPHGKRW
jgi:hypothetical protein